MWSIVACIIIGTLILVIIVQNYLHQPREWVVQDGTHTLVFQPSDRSVTIGLDNNLSLFPELKSPSPDHLQRFGHTLSISVLYIAIGAPGRQYGQYANVGAVYVYRRDTSVLIATIVPPICVPNMEFGTFVQFTTDEQLLIYDLAHQQYQVTI